MKTQDREDAIEPALSAQPRTGLLQTCTPEPLMRSSDRLGAAVGFNDAWLRFTGRSVNASTGDEWLVDVHREDRMRCVSVNAAMRNSGTPYALDYRLSHVEHGHRWVMEQSTPRRSRSGSFDGYDHHCMDIHDRTELGHTLAARCATLRSARRRHASFEAALACELDRLPACRAIAALDLMAWLDSPAASKAASVPPRTHELADWLNAIADRARLGVASRPGCCRIVVEAPCGGRSVDVKAALLGPVIEHGLVCAAVLVESHEAIVLAAESRGDHVRIEFPASIDSGATLLLRRALELHGNRTWRQAGHRTGFELPGKMPA